MLAELFQKAYAKIHTKIYAYNTVRMIPSEWTEKNVYLTSDISRFTGYYKYDVTPYTREVIDCLSSTSPVEQIAVMKCSQSGFTQGVIIPGICYIISESPANILFTAADQDLVKLSVRTRLDPIIASSGLSSLIRPNVVKKKNQRTGDTDFSKEYPGGSMVSVGVNNPNKWRQYSVKFIFADDWDAAPYADKKEGSTRSLMTGRAKSFGSMKKIFYISTPTTKHTSNIEEVFLLGDQRKWNWKCPCCNEFIPIEWRVDKGEGVYAGIKWQTDDAGELIADSVYYECQLCSGKIYETQKYSLNLGGKWIATAVPKRPQYRSYQLNALVIPPGFDSWVDLVSQWLEANPANDVIDEDKLKTFINTQLGQTWEEKGSTPRVSDLMNNMRTYRVGTVPDITCEQDGNGKIVLITLACDLGGVMETNNEDVRVDWEIIGHSATGATYHIEHGSIGTFKRSRKKNKRERENESERVKWTYNHGQTHSVWPELKRIIEMVLIGESGEVYQVEQTVIDTGHFTQLTYNFIKDLNDPFVVGVKGYAEEDYRRISRDTPIIKRSQEVQGKLYLLQTNQLKDILAANMKLVMGMDGYYPSGFMSFPEYGEGHISPGYKYSLPNYFSHFEGEHRVEVKKNEKVIGFAWKKKSSSVENHFFDTSVYNIAAREIYIDVLRKLDPRNAKLTWEDFVALVS